MAPLRVRLDPILPPGDFGQGLTAGGGPADQADKLDFARGSPGPARTVPQSLPAARVHHRRARPCRPAFGDLLAARRVSKVEVGDNLGHSLLSGSMAVWRTARQQSGFPPNPSLQPLLLRGIIPSV